MGMHQRLADIDAAAAACGKARAELERAHELSQSDAARGKEKFWDVVRGLRHGPKVRPQALHDVDMAIGQARLHFDEARRLAPELHELKWPVGPTLQSEDTVLPRWATSNDITEAAITALVRSNLDEHWAKQAERIDDAMSVVDMAESDLRWKRSRITRR